MSAAPRVRRRSGRTGRRAGESGTRQAILEAARARFAEHGYDGATIRAIARDAGVDPALVHHFYGTKEKLFVVAMRFPAVPSEILARVQQAGREGLGEALARTVLELWESEETRAQSIALLRSAVVNERAAGMVRGFVTEAIVGAVARIAGEADAEYRACLVASQMVGLGIVRYVVALEPIASAHPEDLVAALAPTIQRYLTGDLTELRVADRRRRRTGAAIMKA